MNKKKIFISAPISGFNDENKYKKTREQVLKLIQELRKKHYVYYELENISNLDSYDDAQSAVINDFRQIYDSDIFIILHPQRMQSSSLIELGYAIAIEKKIIIISDQENLPFLALGLPIAMTNVKIISFSDFANENTNIFWESLEQMI